MKLLTIVAVLALFDLCVAEVALVANHHSHRHRLHYFDLLMHNPYGATRPPPLPPPPPPLCDDPGPLQPTRSVVVLGNQYLNEVRDLLRATNAFSVVDSAGIGQNTPSLAFLSGYQAVLVYSLNQDITNPSELGNTLADYWDVGGHVVTAAFTCATGGNGLDGKWLSNGYYLLQPGAEDSAVELGPLNITEPCSPLVTDVTSLTALAALKCLGQPVAGATVVAQWGSGVPLIVRGTRDGRRMVTINMAPPSSRSNPSYWNIATDGVQIMRNALLY